MLKLINAPKKSYAEIGQQKSLLMSFANMNEKEGTVTEMFSPIKCRDFLGDCLWAEETGQPAEIFGFRYNPTEQKLDRDRTRVILKFPSEYMTELAKKNLGILNSIEKENGLIPTELEVLEKKILHSYGDPFWMRANFLLSFYTFMFKVLCYDFGGKSYTEYFDTTKEYTNESGYMKSVTTKKFLKLASNLKKIIEPYDGVISKCSYVNNINFIHNNTGFVTTFTSQVTEYGKRAMEISK